VKRKRIFVPWPRERDACARVVFAVVPSKARSVTVAIWSSKAELLQLNGSLVARSSVSEPAVADRASVHHPGRAAASAALSVALGRITASHFATSTR
jgi:hypothetical protein